MSQMNRPKTSWWQQKATSVLRTFHGMPDSKCRNQAEFCAPRETRPGFVRIIWSMRRFACALLLILPVAQGFVIPPARAQSLYTIDQRFGTIEFAVNQLGLFTSSGRFTKFQAALTIDPAHLERTRFVVNVDAVSVNMAWQNGVAMLRSAAYFDVQHYPEVEFRSTEVTIASP